MTPEDLLQACLADVTAGRRTPAECAAAHPDQPELQAQLEAALALRALGSLTVSPAAAKRAFSRAITSLLSNLNTP